MKVFDDLIYWSGGYSSRELKNARDLELRQIRHLGSAVLLSVLASVVGWAIVYDGLIQPGLQANFSVGTVELWLVECLFVACLVTIAFSINRSIIFLSDTRSLDAVSWMLPTLRVVLILVATMINASVLQGNLEIFAFVLAVLEIYPVGLKWQMGQTLTGRRWCERERYEIERCELKVEEHNSALEQEKYAATRKYQGRKESFE